MPKNKRFKKEKLMEGEADAQQFNSVIGPDGSCAEKKKKRFLGRILDEDFIPLMDV